MNKCGYYSCYKGKPTCKHPTYGEQYTKSYGNRLHQKCDGCRRSCGGIYPSQVPRADQTDWEQDILDSNGNVIG